MIVREVLKHPGLIETIDYFNDGRDTIEWLKQQSDAGAVELASRMQVKLDGYTNTQTGNK